jgi:hypothetical protein
VDGDGDGVGDACDGCPTDPDKIDPGICGCGVADTDTDGDGTPDCNDGCPTDPNKIDPGICGCGIAGCVDLSSATPTTSNMGFSYSSGVGYDTYYHGHWRITAIGGYMDFTFTGQYDFFFRALGSTSSGVSYCHVRVSANGVVYHSDLFIDPGWTDYQIPSSSFTSGSNTVRIEQIYSGDPEHPGTHFWISGAEIQ